MLSGEIAGQTPLVSIIITSYNRVHSISRAIESALAQDYLNLEIVISDNNSLDGTDSIIAKYFSDPRVKYSKNSLNIGMIPNFKKATNDLARGEYVVYVSSDDYLEDPGFISGSIAIIRANNRVRIVFGKMITYNLHSGERQHHNYNSFCQKKIWNGFEVFKQFPENGFLCFGGCLMKREDIVKLKVFDSDRLNIDAECILKIMILGDVGFIDRDAYVFVRHGENESGDMTTDPNISKLRYIENVFEFAGKKLPVEKLAELDDWRNRMLNQAIKTSLYFLRMHEQEEFKKYLSFIKTTYPGNLKRIKKDFSWYLKVKLNRRFVLFLYKILKPSYYQQEFMVKEKGVTKEKLS